MDIKVTVITPTARPGWLEEWYATLYPQTFTNFEALFVDERYLQRSTAFIHRMGYDRRFYHVCPPEKKPGRFWNLNAALNYALSIARGELVVFLQDYITLPQNGLELFWNRYQELGPALISGVGHKYLPNGDLYETDPRAQGRGLHVANPVEWEANYAAVPLSICQELGGFDEDFDKGFGFENVNFAERAQCHGFLTWLDEDNQCHGLAHEVIFGAQDFKHQAPSNVNLWRQKNALLFTR